MPKGFTGKREKPEKKKFGKKPKKEGEEEEAKKPVDLTQQLFTKRLQKAQLKDLERNLRNA